MLEQLYKYPKVLDRLRTGLLSTKMDGLAARLMQTGYAPLSVRAYLTRIAKFGKFAAEAGFERPEQLSREVAERFISEFPTPSARAQARTAVAHLLCHLGTGLPEPAGRETGGVADDPLIANFDEYLREVRGLQPRSREGLVLAACRVLVWNLESRPGRSISALNGADVLSLSAFLAEQGACERTRSGSLSHLRSFLRYLTWTGLIREDLARLVPRTPSWRMAHLPARLGWQDIRRTLDAIDCSDPTGLRDRALLLLFATTGARNQELRLLELKDVRWRRGELVLRRTKTRQARVVPLLDEAGAALAEYVLQGRPQGDNPQVFLCHGPPVRPLACSRTVSGIVRRRLARCGLRPAWAGAHLLRHSLATHLVEQGRPIKEIADLLGHRNIDTTAIYVKVALPQLATVALPFPGGLP